jgi:hypothetical protein
MKVGNYFFQDDLNRFLLTNNRLIVNTNGNLTSLLNSNLVEVRPAMHEEFKAGVRNKHQFTKLQLPPSFRKCTWLVIGDDG